MWLKSGWIGEWLLAPLCALLGQPVLLGGLLLLVGILVFSVGKPLGTPLQFFHEKRGQQGLAGFSSTLAVAHVFFVIYLAQAKPDEPLVRSLMVWFVVGWSVVVLTASTIRWVARRAPDKVSTELKLSPKLRDVSREGEASAPSQSSLPEVSPLPFILGTLLGFAVLAVVAYVIAHYLPTLDRLILVELAVAGRMLHPGLHLVALLLTLFALLQIVLLRTNASAALALCSLLVLVATAIGASNYWLGSPTLVTLATLVLIAFAGRELYAIRLSELGELYAKDRLRNYPPPSVTPASGPTLLADALISPGSQPGDWPERQGLGQRRPLILVCTSGGGVRAATWTAGLLARLAEQVPHFSALTMMVTGASGGMVGASYWLTERKRQLEQSQPLDYERLTRAVSRDCLTTITRTLVLNDLPRAIIGGVNRANRAARMQDVWQDEARKVGLDLTQPISAFREAELAGALPSLVFSPMIVEDGRRLLLSNLRLASVSQAEALWLEDATEGRRTVASCNAFHAADVLGPAGDAISLATAARLSASFPYISPAALLPTRPRTRVVDAGYYDNFGIDLVTGWLREALEHSPEWLEAHVSSILVIQIRDDESPLGQPDGRPRALPAPGTGLFAGLARGLQGLSTPLQGVIAARNSVMQLRNDAQLDAMARAYQARFERDVLVYETFELKGDISLSWYLTESEYQKILGQLGAKGINAKIGKIARWVTGKPPV